VPLVRQAFKAKLEPQVQVDYLVQLAYKVPLESQDILVLQVQVEFRVK
jgi:hypothetical protein